MDDKELLHYGVPGMKWGHRKAQNDLKTARRDARKPDTNEEDHEEYKATLRKKSLSSMSTKEIQAENSRLQAEKTYLELTERKQSAGEKFVKEVVTDVGKNAAKGFLGYYATKGVKFATNFIDNAFTNKKKKT